MDVKTAIKHAIDGNALLLLGAGFSTESKNIRGTEMPSAAGLVNCIYEEIYQEYDVPDLEKESLEDLVDRCIEEGYATKLCELLQELFVQQPSSVTPDGNASIIMELPWRRIYSTNYDNVAENHSACQKKIRTPVMLCDSIKTYAASDTIVHLNGLISRLTASTLNSDFKLSSSSYLIDTYQKNEWIRLLKSDIDAASAVILVGISGSSDLDLKRLIYNEGQYKDKIVFIDVQQKKHDIRRKFGDIYTIGLGGLASEIKKMKAIHTPVANQVSYSCFEKFTFSSTLMPLDIDSTSRRNLLEKGILDTEFLQNHIGDSEYLFWRNEISSIETAFSPSENIRCACVTSLLANGKTCFIQLLSAYLYNKGWDIFNYIHDNVNLQRELDSFRKAQKKTLIIVESYHLYFHLLEKLQRVLDNENVFILLSSRTGIHVSVCQNLSYALGISDDNIREYNLDVIDEQDVPNFVELLDKSDYFLKERQHSLAQKKRLIMHTCHSSVADTLMKYVHSQTVKDRINQSCTILSQNSIAKKIAYSSLILMLLNVDLIPSELFAILQINGLPQSVVSNQGFKDIVDLQGGKIQVRSAIFAKYIISTLSAPEILEYMLALNENAACLYSTDKVRAIRSSFATYSNINLLIPLNLRSQNDNKQILEYYYNLSQKKTYDNNPFFWLQYAIASMEVADYSRADELIDMAYTCAQKRFGFDTFQIDTQKGRLILETIDKKETTTPYEDFKMAQQLFKSSANSARGNVRQVIKQIVKLYPKFFSKYKSLLTREEKAEILQNTNEFIKIANNNEYAQKHSRPSEKILNTDIEKLVKLTRAILSSQH